MHKVDIFLCHDGKYSFELATGLNVQDSVSLRINDWFARFLRQYTDSKSIKFALKSEHDEMAASLNDPAKKYMLFKLVAYHNVIRSGDLRTSCVSGLGGLLMELLHEYLADKKTRLDIAEYILFIRYISNMLTGYNISPNGELLESLLKVEAANRIGMRSSADERSIIIKGLLGIIGIKGFHHDIKAFKNILGLIKKEDKTLLDEIRSYKVDNQQGCYNFIHMIFDTDFDAEEYADFSCKKEIIALFDLSRGRQPKESWLKKWSFLETKVDRQKMLALCQKIRAHDEWKKHVFQSGTSWGDDVAKRFLKSAGWIIQLISTQDRSAF